MFAIRIKSHPFSIVYDMGNSSTSSTFETLLVTRDNGIVTVTMNRPSKKNAANATMWAELLAIFREVGTNEQDRAMENLMALPTREQIRAGLQRCATSVMSAPRLRAFRSPPSQRFEALQ
jgi:hypothetical protein